MIKFAWKAQSKTPISVTWTTVFLFTLLSVEQLPQSVFTEWRAIIKVELMNLVGFATMEVSSQVYPIYILGYGTQ